MITIRRSAERGYADHGWLKSFHSFAFADYYDDEQMGFGNLRVINEDRIAPGQGFGTHGHRDMEIVSYVLDGELAHKDSTGTGASGSANSGVIRPGDVQRMSAGTGVRHSEFNHAQDRETHFLQIWLIPEKAEIEPGYEQKHFDDAGKRGRLRLVASPDGRDGSVIVHADALIFAGLFDKDEKAVYRVDPGRIAYVHVVRGRLELNGAILEQGDAAKVNDEKVLEIEHGVGAEVLVFDLAP